MPAASHGLFGTAGGGPSSGGSLFAAPSEQRAAAAPMGQQPAFASLAAFAGSGRAGGAGASLASQFADLDIGELQQAGYESFAAGGEMPAGMGGMLGADLAGMFGSAPAGAAAAAGASAHSSGGLLGSAGASGHLLQQHQQDAGLEVGAELLSRDLLGELGGLQPAATGGQQGQGAPSGLLHLPDNADALFAPSAQSPAAGAPPGSFSAFRSLW
jgi:hypothetical protein